MSSTPNSRRTGTSWRRWRSCVNWRRLSSANLRQLCEYSIMTKSAGLAVTAERCRLPSAPIGGQHLMATENYAHPKVYLGTKLPRRRWLQQVATSAAAGLVAGRIPHSPLIAADTITPTADLLVAGKDRRLIVHNGSTTGFEIETPLDLLSGEQITPVERLFVRNNQQPEWSATLKPAPTKDWKLEIEGLLAESRTVTLDELRAMPQREHEIVLQCSGNGRALFGAAAPVKGAPWRHGAMGCVRFRGVLLRDVLKKLDVRPKPEAQFVTAQGTDSPALPDGADFEHSLPLHDVLARSLLALELNGIPLPAVHGGPLRLVTPGYYGTMHVKWLSRLRLDATETTNHHQVKRYRTPLDQIEPGAPFDYRLENSEPNWRMRIKSVVFAPIQGARVPAGEVLAKGVAWNDGTSRIDAVETSLDGGHTWRRAELEPPSDRYAWYRWQTPLTVAAGDQLLLCRAIDTLGNTQPLDGAADWNPAGYGWHGVERVRFQAI
ncbi:MAG: sulfite reductase [Pirellula sp.]|nr:sulfite reductase [Pirellula sp.]